MSENKKIKTVDFFIFHDRQMYVKDMSKKDLMEALRLQASTINHQRKALRAIADLTDEWALDE